MFTTRDAAGRLGIKPRSVVQLIKRGLLAAEKKGRDYLLTIEEVDRYQRERKPAHRPRSVSPKKGNRNGNRVR